jgi:hypothetical protein
MSWVLRWHGKSPLQVDTGGGDGFDEWLARELRESASNQPGVNPLPSTARYQAAHLPGGPVGRLTFALAAMLSTKLVTALAVSAIALVAAGATTEAVITGSDNPTVWGRQVVLQVQKCKVALTSGSHGIGGCVSGLASQHGSQEGTTPGAGEKPTPASESPSDRPGGGPPSDHPGGGPPSDHPGGGPPSDHPGGGPPSDHPGGGNPGDGGSGGNGNGNGNGGGGGRGHVSTP